ncbi:phenoloxidase-activating factor 2 [Ceratina calcarata]|uniref:Phenoloxidase-activating factor 2 n=1 Tax=Ceratina calcarata TaxID=156304 RepID=A0AAJ7J801_9HYME|nr:phenoloxidase-activating factor 2 [Ceratina calcarata]
MFRGLSVAFFVCLLRNSGVAQLTFDNTNASPSNNANNCRCLSASQCSSTNPADPAIDIRIVNPGANNCNSGQVYCCPGSSSGNGDTQSCGIRKISLSSHPQGQASYGAYPWQAVLLNSNNGYVGSGVLITPNHVLTVAHKVSSYTTGGLKVRLGDWNAQTTNELYPSREYTVQRISIHPQYNSANLQNDVAVITLSGTVPISTSPNINTACLPTAQPASGTRCWVSGWGKDEFGTSGQYQSIMKEVDVPIVDQTVCENDLRTTRLGQSFVLNRNSFLCAGGEQNKDACTGDGGSPLVCQSGNAQWQVVGMVSWGIGCASRNVPGVYVNVYNYVPWISQQTTQSK